MLPETAVPCVDQAAADGWALYQGDSVALLRGLPADSIHYSIFSPPFGSLFVYSDSPRDVGNCRTDDEFEQHMAWIAAELHRVTKPGRLLSFHCMLLPTSKERDGFIGLRDFRGDLIRMFQAAGFIFHSEVVIWKDPVTAMQRTKALGLLHKQLVKDSCMSRQGIPDYVVTMRKPGTNAEPVAGYLETYEGDDASFDPSVDPRRDSINIWQRYASPVWMDIRPSRTLQRDSAREDKDERHICPLQLDVIERCIDLWTNPGDVVLSPFAGIGSEGVVAMQMERRFVGIELKRSYFQQAARNVASAKPQGSLFATATTGDQVDE